MALFTASDLYPYIPGLTSGADAALDALLTRVESFLAAYLGWPEETDGAGASWDSASRTFYLDGPSGSDPRVLRLPVKPYSSITTIHDDPLWSYGSSSLVAAGDYTEEGRTGKIYLNPDASHGGWSEGSRVIQVVAVAGFSAGTSAPPSLMEGTLRYAALAHAQRKGGAARAQASAGSARSSFKPLKKFPADIKRLLAAYRCPSFWLS